MSAEELEAMQKQMDDLSRTSGVKGVERLALLLSLIHI